MMGDGGNADYLELEPGCYSRTWLSSYPDGRQHAAPSFIPDVVGSYTLSEAVSRTKTLTMVAGQLGGEMITTSRVPDLPQ